MRFLLSDEQRGFSQSLHDLLTGSEVAPVSRAWGRGEPESGLKLWQRLADLGVSALRVPEGAGGLGAEPIDVVVAFEQLGRHLVPGPWIESAVVAPALLSSIGGGSGIRPEAVAAGSELVTVCAPPGTPFALDADVADHVLLVQDHQLTRAAAAETRRSVDNSRRLFTVTATEPIAALAEDALRCALDEAALACAAQLLGAGERLLAEAVEYTGARRQFGRPIAEYQALKHAMADIRVGLDFARPLVHGAAVAVAQGATTAPRDVSAAKVAASEAAYRASRTALQMHGAIGYTDEYDLGLWIRKVRALVGAWGTPSAHRARVLAAVTPSSP